MKLLKSKLVKSLVMDSCQRQDTEYFFMQSALIRTVGASMVLEAPS